jgi:hypothetical protein
MLQLNHPPETHSFLLAPGGGNISQITDAKYRDVLRTYARVMGDLCTVVVTTNSDGVPEAPHPRVASSDYSWFERICFSLTALVIQCELTCPRRSRL